jgi:hypothetical protein
MSRYVIRQGRRIEVETLDTGIPAKKTRVGQFVQVPLDWATKATKATKTPQAMVWIELLRLAWWTKSDTVALSNEPLKRVGVSRHAKYRALRALTAAGLITVEWRNRQAPRVTIVRS